MSASAGKRLAKDVVASSLESFKQTTDSTTHKNKKAKSSSVSTAVQRTGKQKTAKHSEMKPETQAVAVPTKQLAKKPASLSDECAWFDFFVGVDEDYRRYMREEWGFEKRGDQPLFEKLCLEGAQAGLSWATILKKREAYRRAFHGFDIERCAAMSSSDVERLLTDERTGVDQIVKNGAKVQSVVRNANAVLALRHKEEARGGVPPRHGYFDRFLWSFVGGSPKLHNRPVGAPHPTKDEVSEAMSRELKALGFNF
ncbi:MAG: hypothetical protein SGPRY_001814, partial [Prymnesium sp.]